MGDILEIAYGGKITEVEVLLVAESIKASEAAEMYRIISEKKITVDDIID